MRKVDQRTVHKNGDCFMRVPVKAHGRHAPRAVFVCTVIAAAIGSAYAQTAPAPSSPASAAESAGSASATARPGSEAIQVLETVTVSATRRAELVRDVPLAITSLPAERLQEVGAKSLNDYLQSVPGVVLQNSSLLDNGGFIIIRGMTTGIDSRSPTTVYIDETPLADGTPFDINLLDVSRFEVLRGPQGTLYGSSAMGGIVKYLTQQPDTSELYGRVNLGLSGTAHGGTNGIASAVINAPLREDFAALRVAAFGSRDGGYVDATGAAGGKDVNSKKARGGRVDLSLTPTKEFSVRLNAMTQTRESDGGNRVVYDLKTQKPLAGDLVYTELGVKEPREGSRDLYSATLEYDFGWARLSSVTSHQTVKDISRVDLTPLGTLLLGATNAYADSDVRNRKTTQEFRLVSQTPGAIQWLVGAFFDRFDLSTQSTVSATGGPIPGALTIDGAERDYRESALYGNVTWNATQDLALTAGLRLARYKQKDTVKQDGLLVGPQPQRTVEFSESPETYLLAAKYRLTPRSNLYARAASGYRPGGVNNNAVDPLTGQPIPGVPSSYGTDSVWSYEAGYKLSLPDSGTSFEVALFQTDWNDLQQSTTVNSVTFGTNLGKARIRGIEFSGGLQPLRHLTLGGSVSLLDPKLLTDSPGLQAKSGDRLPNTPKVAATLGARYAFEVAGHPAFSGLGVTYQGERNSGFPDSVAPPNYKLPSFTQVDLSGGVSFGKVGVNLYIRNLTDKRGQLGASTGDAPALGRTYVFVTDPRTIGLDVSVPF
ncbi:TonB-dependent receptor [Roseateles violae]|uniref:TonB-dependent receptor n=1 Tax=Roseateles violae TaxID=3058042 RepID=A0ABT8E042_9BURK|nr:TonB-dependent receptor [Pelomonas sp. PFR6]MDN3923198.1 TonB-dependent receptor [Pelomonas sp. PFR6]